MKKEARRNFLKKSMLGISGAIVLPGTSGGAIPGSVTGTASRKDLVYRTLGRTGIKLPVISLGAGSVKNPNFVRAVLDAGIKLIQTSSYYGEGNNEKMLSDVLKDRPRDSFLIATSSQPQGTDPVNGIFTDPGAGKAFTSDIEGGLERLGLDYVDIIFLPFTAKRESVFYEPLLRTMEDLKKQGKTRYIGIATHSYCEEAIRAAADTKVYDLVMTAYNFRTENAVQMNEAIGYATSAGLGILGMKSQAGAFRDRERTQPVNSKATLKWVLQNENVTSIVSGMSNVEELQQNIEMMNDLELSEQEMNDLELASAGSEPGLYCLQCSRCIPQCPHQLDIPTVMRSYMYAYGYGDPGFARRTLDCVDLSENYCTACQACRVECPMGFDVGERIRDISRLKDVPPEFLRA